MGHEVSGLILRSPASRMALAHDKVADGVLVTLNRAMVQTAAWQGRGQCAGARGRPLRWHSAQRGVGGPPVFTSRGDSELGGGGVPSCPPRPAVGGRGAYLQRALCPGSKKPRAPFAAGRLAGCDQGLAFLRLVSFSAFWRGWCLPRSRFYNNHDFSNDSQKSQG